MENTFIEVNDLQYNALPFQNLLKDAEKELFNLNSNLVEYSRRDTIIKQNSRTSHVLFIKSGLVKISKEMRKGKSIMLKIEGPGNFIGLSSVFGGEIYEYSVSAIEPTVVNFTDIRIIKEIIANNGSVGLDVITQVSKDNLFNIDKLSSLLYKQLPGRIADIIIYFSEHIYKNNTFTIPLTRQELAELAGTTKESLIRTLSEFKNDKIIEMDRNTISIVSPKIIHTLSRLG
jgi:CRP/FNR family transcriptional regulator, polysaccharide utilization system transcription regulator